MKITTLMKPLLFVAVGYLTACGGGAPAGSNEPGLGNAGSDYDAAHASGMLASPNHKQAYRLLERSTFGPTPPEIENVVELGMEKWIDRQIEFSPTLMHPALARRGDSNWNEYVNVWWRHTLTAPDQLRQRVAFALSQIFVVSAADGLGDEQYGLANYYDILVRNAFGNYRDLLDEITVNPIMGEYLSMKGNQKPDAEQNIRPDENFARELLQLFSIGLVQLNEDGSVKRDSQNMPLPSYDQTVVEGFAHVFTGWHFANADDFRWPGDTDYINPMQPWEDWHDTGSKQLLRGFVQPAGASAREDLRVALDNIFNHPNVGPFIGRQLIQKLVTSNPSETYVRDIAKVFNANEHGVRGDLGSVVKAILLHEEALTGHINSPETFGKLKEPVLRVTSLWRAFMPTEIHPEWNYAWAQNDIGQAPLNSPSVFNFFTPDFSQPGEIRNRGLLSPEFQMLDESTLIGITSRLLANSIWSHNHRHESDRNRIVLDIDDEVELQQRGQEILLDQLDMKLLGGRMSAELRAAVIDSMDSYDYPSAGPQKVVEAIFLIASSPEGAIQF